MKSRVPHRYSHVSHRLGMRIQDQLGEVTIFASSSSAELSANYLGKFECFYLTSSHTLGLFRRLNLARPVGGQVGRGESRD